MNNIIRKFIKLLYQSKLRGRTRITLFLANKLKSLQSIPVKIDDGATLFVDLRLMSTHGIFLGWTKGAEDEELIDGILLPNDIAYDIGVHVGLYSVMMSRIVGTKGKIYSFEINPEVLPSLRKTLEPLKNVTLYPYGLADKSGETFLYIPTDPSAASLADWTEGKLGNVHKVRCELRRLDDLVKSENLLLPDFIKIDVEGAEELVFKGAEKTLNRKDAPIIFFEVSKEAQSGFGLDETSAMNFLKNLSEPNYQFYDAREKTEKLVPINEIPPRIKGALAVNILAVPESKLYRIKT